MGLCSMWPPHQWGDGGGNAALSHNTGPLLGRRGVVSVTQLPRGDTVFLPSWGFIDEVIVLGGLMNLLVIDMRI